MTDDRKALRERIDNLECIYDLIRVIEEVEGDEAAKVGLSINDPNSGDIAFLHNLPHDVLLIGLRAMRNELGIRVQEAEGITA